jgi:biotin carboxyl carrier protein
MGILKTLVRLLARRDKACLVSTTAKLNYVNNPQSSTFDLMYTANVDDRVFEISFSDGGFIVNGKQVSWDLSQIQEGYFHILLNGRGYRAEIVDMDTAAKRFVIKINGKDCPVVLKDKFDVLLEKMGLNANVGARVNHVRAPMPGLIIQLKVKDGDEVKAGDTLLILEAMKMENIIKAPGDAVVKSVKVRMGEGVEKNQVLIEF